MLSKLVHNVNGKSTKPSLLIVGGGIVGLTIAREANLSKSFSSITVLEKENKFGMHASTRNSGVIHAGFYYTPDSQRGRFCSKANELMRNYCIKNSIPVNRCGKVVVTRNSNDEQSLEELYKRGKANGSDISLFTKEKLSKYEPLAYTYERFLWSPNTWSASPKYLLSKIIQELKEAKVKLINSTKVSSVEPHKVITEKGERFFFDILINSSGGYSLSLAKECGLYPPYKLLPFKGIYLKSNKAIKTFKSHIYPVPNISQPFLGIHTTITYDNFLKLGPTAIPVLSPENYSLFEGLDLSITPEIFSLQISCLLSNSFNFRDLALKESKYLIKSNIIKEAQKLTYYKLNDISFDWYSPGIRPQLFNTDKRCLEMDFVFLRKESTFHVLNSISPAWTCSFKTAQYVLDEVLKSIRT